MRPFRFGATIVPGGGKQGWADAVRGVAEAGYSTLTVMDHFWASGIWGPLVAAHHAAPELRLGTVVMNGDLWNPAIAAREAISVDQLTDGKVELGIGAGWAVADYAAAGVERAPAAVRIARLREAIRIYRLAFAGEPVRFEGEHYSVDGGEPWPRPVQERLPLLIGGGARPILELAAQEADIVSVHRNLQDGVEASWSTELGDTGPYPDAVARRIAWIRDAAGERFDSLELHAIVLKAVVTDRRDEVAAELAAHHALGSVDRLLESPHYLIGTVDQIAADLVDRRERWGISYWTLVDGNDRAAFGEVVRRLSGT